MMNWLKWPNQTRQTKLEGISAEIGKKNELLAKKDAELKTAHKMVSDTDELRKQLKSKNVEFAKVETERNELKTKISRLNDELTKKLAESNRANEEAKKKIEEVSAEIGKKNEILAKKDAEIKTALKTAASKNVSEELKKQLMSKKDEYAKIETERDDLKTKISKLNAEIENQKKTNEQMKTAKTAAVEPKSKEVVKESKAPNEAEINLLLKEGDAADKKGNKDAAIWHYEKILTLAPDNNAALTRLGYIYSDRGDDEKTLKYVERSLCYEPYDVHKLLIAAFAYIRKGEYYLALGVLSRAAAQDPKNPELQRYLGVACSNLGWVESAERQFHTAFDLDPKSSETAFNLAVLLATSEPSKMTEARKWYKKARELGAETDPGMERLFKE
jgi:Flp pilus assembly protein TadD